ncbi:HAL/PAL/TAL family ammonia-lyase [Lichenifustis flavocetrariae]|uniref:Histidine ammonia-lyase n=1 Tax=Lichenifustis flavocetrariae TaxID=2949735 RepID=A0AA41YYR0_9HYPH|nr:histidine ammonia-lyase [Lichenifustis flavocetrariae]MCW6511046.1 histidine ammonia-lyase [Lichenifustis flavocetrariae]
MQPAQVPGPDYCWRDIAAIADGAPMRLSGDAEARIARARLIVDAIVAKGVRAYGVNTGVGALSETVVPREDQRSLSRHIVLSHAVATGPLMSVPETRAIMAAAIANMAHGHSGVRPELVTYLLALLDQGCTPSVPRQGSVGYVTHMAHVALVLIGEGEALVAGQLRSGQDALACIGLSPLTLDTKEGLSVINGTPCATGLACLALARAERLLDWADAVAALSFECLGGQLPSISADAMAMHRSPGLGRIAEVLRSILDGSERLKRAQGMRLQDALSVRAVPQVHGAARDAFEYAASVIDRELASCCDNPLVHGTPTHPQVSSTAHAVGAGVALAMDTLAIAVAEVAAMAERRLDRLLNPLVSGLPPFLAETGGVHSGLMIAQYAAASLVSENRRLAGPASLDGGVTSGLQEDHLSHATPASLKALAIISNSARVIGTEWVAATQASDLYHGEETRAPGTERLHARLRALLPPYADDRPLGRDLDRAARVIREENVKPVGTRSPSSC